MSGDPDRPSRTKGREARRAQLAAWVDDIRRMTADEARQHVESYCALVILRGHGPKVYLPRQVLRAICSRLPTARERLEMFLRFPPATQQARTTPGWFRLYDRIAKFMRSRSCKRWSGKLKFNHRHKETCEQCTARRLGGVWGCGWERTDSGEIALSRSADAWEAAHAGLPRDAILRAWRGKLEVVR